MWPIEDPIAESIEPAPRPGIEEGNRVGRLEARRIARCHPAMMDHGTATMAAE
jgi:hypothetical protein